MPLVIADTFSGVGLNPFITAAVYFVDNSASEISSISLSLFIINFSMGTFIKYNEIHRTNKMKNNNNIQSK